MIRYVGNIEYSEERIKIGLLTLHSWGNIIYFGNLKSETSSSSKSNEIIILNADWLSKMMSCLTKSKLQGGILKSNESNLIWIDKTLYPLDIHSSILLILEKFDLIVELERRKENNNNNKNNVQEEEIIIYLVPCILSNEKPQEKMQILWKQEHLKESWNRIYQFSHQIPLGLFHMLMVKILKISFSKIDEEREYWKNGMILFSSQESLCILIEMDEERKKIIISCLISKIEYQQQRDKYFLQIIEEMESILQEKYSQQLPVKIFISCKCDECLNGSNPHLFPFSEKDCNYEQQGQSLETLKQLNLNPTCDHSFTEISLSDLLPQSKKILEYFIFHNLNIFPYI